MSGNKSSLAEKPRQQEDAPPKKKTGFFSINTAPPTRLSLSQQKAAWFKEFLKPFLVVCIAYSCMYLVRYNFKTAQPELLQQTDLTLTDLGMIGTAFSVTYGISRTLLGFFIDGRNTKRILTALTMASASISVIIGAYLWTGNSAMGVLLVLWGANGVLGSPGGPCSVSTLNRWTPPSKRAQYMGWWNASHNVGGSIGGILAVWGASTFFGGHVAGYFIVPGLIAGSVALILMFVGKDEPQELGWARPDEIFEEPPIEAIEASANMSKGQILIHYVLKNPTLWLICASTIFTYVLRTGVDNWTVVYTVDGLGFSLEMAASTIIALELGGFTGCLFAGVIADKLGGRRALVSAGAVALMAIPLTMYINGTNAATIYVSLFLMGMLIYAPFSLQSATLLDTVPPQSGTFVSAIPGTFGYLVGDSFAKIMLARIADPEREGVDVFGRNLHGWSDAFGLLYVAIIGVLITLGIVAFMEGRRLRARAAKAAEVKAKLEAEDAARLAAIAAGTAPNDATATETGTETETDNGN